MNSFFRRITPFVVLFFLWLPAHRANAEEAPAPPLAPAMPEVESAAVVVWGRTLVSYRLPLEFPNVHRRALVTAERINQALGQIDADKIVVQPVQIGKGRGLLLAAGPVFLLSIMEGDIDPLDGVTLDVVAAKVADEIRTLVHDHAKQNTLSVMIRASVQAVIATLLFTAFWAATRWIRAKILLRIAWSTKEAGHALVIFGYDWRHVLLGLATTATRLLMLTVVLSAAYGWVTYVLSLFPYTRHWGDQLGGYLMSAVSNLASGAVHQIPNLIALIVIYLMTRGMIRVLNGWFFAVESGKHSTVWLDPEAARATRRLVAIGIWIVALIVAFPYFPGSHSEAFKGISVFLGLMLSLGGAGFVSQIIGGMAAVYSRAVRSGDYIMVGETQGVVKELGLLTTKVITRTREEVTIPNSILISSAIRNFSRAGNNATLLSTAVTIGYDAPWRQVQAMLLQAAAHTEGILKNPPPYVLQTALDDFYVSYELTACVESASVRSGAMDRLHGNIQDVFNEHGVQIMSPHYENQPPDSVGVPKNRWFTKPAVGESASRK